MVILLIAVQVKPLVSFLYGNVQRIAEIHAERTVKDGRTLYTAYQLGNANLGTVDGFRSFYADKMVNVRAA